MHRPTTGHWSAVKCLFVVFARYDSFELFLQKNSPLSLHVFSDADWARNVDDPTSTSAYIVFLGSNAILRSSKKQKTVIRSSTGTEHKAVATTASELSWIQSLLHELGVTCKILNITWDHDSHKYRE